MDNKQNIVEKVGGILILVIAAIIFLSISQRDTIQQLFISTEPSSLSLLNVVSTLPEQTPTPSTEQTETADSLIPLQLLPIPDENSLAPHLNPYTLAESRPQHQFVTYQIQPGDTPNIIADKHGISAETLLGGNPWLSNESSQLQTGAEIIILPVDGVLHTIEPGETLESIATQYGVDVDTIINYAPNNLNFPYRIYPKTQLLIPGVSLASFQWTAPKSVGNSGGPNQWAVVGTGSFNWPVGGRCITNYYWYGHPGLDVSLREGSPVTAADTGTVTYASWASGTYYDYGNLIVINHGNGFETFYAHLSSIGVYPGQIVEKGQWIGASGNTGRSSGPHIHIEIRLNDVRLNPLSYFFGSTQNCTGS